MPLRRIGPCLLLTALAGCQGNIEGSIPGSGTGPGPGDPSIPGEVPPGSGFDTKSECQKLGTGLNPGPSPLRRLTRDEYDGTIAELASDTSKPARDFPPEARALGFNNVADGQTVTTLLAEAYKSAAEGVAERATANAQALLGGCAATEGSCVDGFIQRFGSRAYRRPIAPAEAQRLRTVYDWAVQKTTALDGVKMVMEVLLQSPDFLYRPELGAGVAAPGVLHLSSYEMATRLSYLFRGSMPDQTLLDEAAADRLKTADQVTAQAQRLLSDPRARDTFKSFHSQWLDLDRVNGIDRDPNVYSGYSDAIPALLEQETTTFIDHVIFEDGGKLNTLLTAPYTFANSTLASFYGLTASGDSFSKVATDPSKQKGLLTQGSLLAMHSAALQSSPVHRGKFVRESLLCQFLPPPPANLVITPPELNPNVTTRERFAQHSADAACSGCHQQMDPIGLGFEHFDAVGRWRDTENNLPIDATGNLVLTDVDGDFDGAVALADKLASSQQVADCMMKEWARFTYGRSETTEDACSLQHTKEKFAAADHDIKQLVLALTQTDAFLYRKAVVP